MNANESPLHLLADSLIDYFDSSEAVNYIEQTFTCNNDNSKSFVITMRKVEGLTPCEKLAKAESLNADMYEMLESKLDLIRCGIGANYSGDPKQNPKYLEVVELLKRARGE